MATLWFIGTGLGDEQDLSRRAIDRLRATPSLFAEEYTSLLLPGALERLAADVGRPIRRLDRAEVESERPILEALSTGDAALLVAGDPFAATTHVALRSAAENAGHRWGYLPNASILTAAAGFLGLMPYRFGRTVSLPFPEPGFAPTSPVEAIGANRAARLHSLVLLDLRPSEGRFLTANAGLRILRERDPDARFLPSELGVAVVARVGAPDARAWWGSRSLLETIEFGAPLHAIVVPAADLHFEESEALGKFAVAGPPRRED